MIRTAHNQTSMLDITRVAMSLHNTTVGHTIDYHASIPSTMPLAYSMAIQPETRSGTLVVAEEQTAGLGRLQRNWVAPSHQALLVSLILKGNHLPANPAHLPMLAGLAVLRAIVATTPELVEEIGLKWPNDVLLGLDLASGRKVAGVLIETSFRREKMEHAIIGMGINVNQTADQLPPIPPEMPQPTSLREYTGRAIDRSALLVALCQVWSELLESDAGVHDIYHEWRNVLYTLGQPVTVRRGGLDAAQAMRGRAVDVTPDGELVVVDEMDCQHTIGAGDVTTRPD
jgi:BirA family biotin operon repressor/biotin-[acetyl-CoA-carboxylase] ligase